VWTPETINGFGQAQRFALFTAGWFVPRVMLGLHNNDYQKESSGSFWGFEMGSVGCCFGAWNGESVVKSSPDFCSFLCTAILAAFSALECGSSARVSLRAESGGPLAPTNLDVPSSGA